MERPSSLPNLRVISLSKEEATILSLCSHGSFMATDDDLMNGDQNKTSFDRHRCTHHVSSPFPEVISFLTDTDHDDYNDANNNNDIFMSAHHSSPHTQPTPSNSSGSSSTSSTSMTSSSISFKSNDPNDVGHIFREPVPHYPVGPLEVLECGVCLNLTLLYRRPCCGFPCCNDCLTWYFESKVEDGVVTIECPNTGCTQFCHRDEISTRLRSHLKDRYQRFLANSNATELCKTCPCCNTPFWVPSIKHLKAMMKASSKDPDSVRVECAQCQYLWCFPCCSPWHQGISCKDYGKGDKLLFEWAKRMSHGQVNAQRCPRCRVLIQKSSGCDHMHCTKCKTDFCYRCGDPLRRLKFFGDHYSRLSVFGCKYRFKANQPVRRKLIRGAVFTSKLVVAPILGSLAVVAGAVVIGVGVAALPLYGGIRLYRKYQHANFHVGFTPNSVGQLKMSNKHSDIAGLNQTPLVTRITFIGDDYVEE